MKTVSKHTPNEWIDKYVTLEARVLLQTSTMTIKEISDAGVSILYLYSFLWKGKGVLVFRADQSEKAKESIMLNKLTFLTEEDFRA